MNAMFASRLSPNRVIIGNDNIRLTISTTEAKELLYKLLDSLKEEGYETCVQNAKRNNEFNSMLNRAMMESKTS
ncbi:MAG: hypothetical protein GQ570_02715 [Helicobacteraceae bacterium]|nr:hypothetical protein [Helicobacteraceae bacterium]